MKKEVYLDNSATTFIDKNVLDTYYKAMKENYGNPSSLHQKGVDSGKMLKEAKKIIANTLKVKPSEIYFTSGGTESNNLSIHGCINAFKNRGKKIITTKIEHPSVLEVFKYYQSKGFDVVFLNVDEKGLVDLDMLQNEVDKNTILVSVMAVNNEIGTKQPLVEIGQIIKEKNPLALFHVDAVQGYGKIDIDIKKSNISLLSISGHKLHGPKGVGALYIKDKLKITPILLGGGQQSGMRSGTENVAGYFAMAKACEIIYENFDDNQKVNELRQIIWNKLYNKLEKIMLITPLDASAPHILNIAFKGIKGEILLHSLESKGIFVSTGSACSAKDKNLSHVLKALNIHKDYIDGAIRISFSRFNTLEEVEYITDNVVDAVKELRLLMF